MPIFVRKNHVEMTNTIQTLKTCMICCLLATQPLIALAEGKMQENICPIVRIEAERLPDLNIPRSGHSAFVVHGEVTVVGGHTSGFKLTPTAEYFKDGAWHLLHTVYSHDGGFSIALKSGKVLLAGGFKDNLGIGQSFEVELYDPINHHFEGFGCLDQKRASATAIELDSGRVMITGNWYADDGMELFDGHEFFSHLKPVSQPRCLPHLFKTSDGDVLVVAGYDYKGQPFDTPIVDRMKGDAFYAPLFETWHPLQYDLPLHSDDCFIGDEAKDIFAYLIPVKDKEGQVAIAEVRDTIFSILPTDYKVPMASQWGEISYYTPVYADRQHQRGYVMGCDSTGRQYALCIDYAKVPAHLTLYHTNPLTESLALTIPVMTEDGNLMLTGIKPTIKYNLNFYPTAQTWLLHINGESQYASKENKGSWLWAGIIIGILVVISLFTIWLKKKSVSSGKPEEHIEPSAVKSDEQLMQRIRQLMEEQKPYLNSELKVADVADALKVRRNLVSDCVSSQEGCTFSTFVNKYRVEYAKQLLSQHPDMKINTIGNESGFANDTSFFRTFKAITGMTPSEWKGQID